MSHPPTSRSFLLLDKLPSKAKESLARELLKLAEGVTPNSVEREHSHFHGRLKLCLSYSSAYIIIVFNRLLRPWKTYQSLLALKDWEICDPIQFGCATPDITFLVIVSLSIGTTSCISLTGLFVTSLPAISFSIWSFTWAIQPPRQPITKGTISTLNPERYSHVSKSSYWYFHNFSMFFPWCSLPLNKACQRTKFFSFPCFLEINPVIFFSFPRSIFETPTYLFSFTFLLGLLPSGFFVNHSFLYTLFYSKYLQCVVMPSKIFISR